MKRMLAGAAAMLAAGAAGAEAPPRIGSQVAGLEIRHLTDLPPAPRPTGDRSYCEFHFLADATSPAAAAVAAKGWEVTGEAAFGPYAAVSFIGDYAALTSGACDLKQGNVGLFSGDRLVALVYGSDADALRIGRVDPFGDGGLRISDGGPLSQPVADLRLIGGADIAVTPPAPEEPVCGDTARVPYVNGLPIDLARILLAGYGWQPVPQPPSGFGIAPVLVAAGVPEVEECSGTGFGFCTYVYAGPAGGLSVVTVGEPSEDRGLPAVTGHGVTCATP